MEKNLHLGLGRVIQGQSARANRPVSGTQQAPMTIFSAVMLINDRRPCIRYTRAALRRGRGEGEGPGRFPVSWGSFFEVGSPVKRRLVGEPDALALLRLCREGNSGAVPIAM